MNDPGELRTRSETLSAPPTDQSAPAQYFPTPHSPLPTPHAPGRRPRCWSRYTPFHPRWSWLLEPHYPSAGFPRTHTRDDGETLKSSFLRPASPRRPCMGSSRPSKWNPSTPGLGYSWRDADGVSVSGRDFCLRRSNAYADGVTTARRRSVLRTIPISFGYEYGAHLHSEIGGLVHSILRGDLIRQNVPC